MNLSRNNTISDAFKAINGRFGMVVTIIEEGNRFCGIVSEGDLRNAILNGKSVNTPLVDVMNTKPIIIQLKDLDDELKRVHVIDQIYQRYGNGLGQQATIPVISENHKLIGLVVPEMLQIKGSDATKKNGRRSGHPHVLVVGGAGYIGSIFTRVLLAEGWKVRILDNFLYKQTSLEGIESEYCSIVHGDVTNINDLVETIEGIDAVVYLAEIVGDAACAYRPGRALKTNYLSVANMAHLCAYLNINRFIYTSSCSVYGGSRDPEAYLSEDCELNPVSYYGRMKIMTEQALLGISSPLFAPTILRLATVFGYSYRPRFDLVVNTFAKNAFFKKCIEVFGGNQWRPNVHVIDVARAIIKTLEAPIDKVSRQVFNVGNGEQNHTINTLADLTTQVFPEVKIRHITSSPDTRNYRVNFNKIEQILGYRAQIKVLEGLRELKSVFEKGDIANTDDSRHSNLEALKGIDSK